MPQTYLRASSKILSSSQSGLPASNSRALLLCSRSSTVTKLITSGFWLTLLLPDNLHCEFWMGEVKCDHVTWPAACLVLTCQDCCLQCFSINS